MKYCCRFFATRQCNFVAENNQENHAINTVQTALEPQLRSDKLSLLSQPAKEAQCGTKICPMMFVQTYDGSAHCTHDCCKCDIHLHPPLEETLGSHSDDLGLLPACKSVCRSSQKKNQLLLSVFVAFNANVGHRSKLLTLSTSPSLFNFSSLGMGSSFLTCYVLWKWSYTSCIWSHGHGILLPLCRHVVLRSHFCS